VVAGDDADGLAVGLLVGVDRRVGAEIAGVDRPREQGLDRGRAALKVAVWSLSGPRAWAKMPC